VAEDPEGDVRRQKYFRAGVEALTDISLIRLASPRAVPASCDAAPPEANDPNSWETHFHQTNC